MAQPTTNKDYTKYALTPEGKQFLRELSDELENPQPKKAIKNGSYSGKGNDEDLDFYKEGGKD